MQRFNYRPRALGRKRAKEISAGIVVSAALAACSGSSAHRAAGTTATTTSPLTTAGSPIAPTTTAAPGPGADSPTTPAPATVPPNTGPASPPTAASRPAPDQLNSIVANPQLAEALGLLQSGSPANLPSTQLAQIIDRLDNVAVSLGVLATKIASHGGSGESAVAKVEQDVNLINENVQAIQTDVAQPNVQASHDVPELKANIQKYNADLVAARADLASQ